MALFALNSPSLLAFDTQRVEGNVDTIDGLAHGPCDTAMRATLEPVAPEALRPVFRTGFRPLQRGNALAKRVCLNGASLLALAGTGSCSSQTMHWDSCLHNVHRHGTSTSDHQMVGAALIHPDFRAVMPWMPEPIVHQDGTEKHAGERHAATRCITTVRQDPPHRTCIVPEDRLRAHAPHIEALHAAQCHASLGGNEGEHAQVCQHVQAAAAAGTVTSYARHARATGVVQRCRCIHAVPRNASRADIPVNGMESWEIAREQGQHCRWVTDCRISTRNVYTRMQGGRARWKIDKETLNT